MFPLSCVIFAGGKSSRMGEDKALLPFGEFPTLTQYQYARLSQIFQNVYISCKNKSKFDFEANFIEDVKGEYAPTLGFVSIFQTLQDERVFVLGVDTPFVTQDIIQKLLDADTALSDATIAKLDGRTQAMCGIYHRSLASKFENMQKTSQHKLGFLLKESNTNYVDFTDKNAFLNLNHPHEYQEALKYLNNR
jgi:molybdopterin-guanine dinucleotide biosynthesis protein A